MEYTNVREKLANIIENEKAAYNSLQSNFEEYEIDFTRFAKSICFLDFIKILVEVSLRLHERSNVFKITENDSSIKYIPEELKYQRKIHLLGDDIDFDQGHIKREKLSSACSRLMKSIYSNMEDYMTILDSSISRNVVLHSRSRFSGDEERFLSTINELLKKYLDGSHQSINAVVSNIEQNVKERIIVTPPRDTSPERFVGFEISDDSELLRTIFSEPPIDESEHTSEDTFDTLQFVTVPEGSTFISDTIVSVEEEQTSHVELPEAEVEISFGEFVPSTYTGESADEMTMLYSPLEGVVDGYTEMYYANSWLNLLCSFDVEIFFLPAPYYGNLLKRRAQNEPMPEKLHYGCDCVMSFDKQKKVVMIEYTTNINLPDSMYIQDFMKHNAHDTSLFVEIRNPGSGYTVYRYAVPPSKLRQLSTNNWNFKEPENTYMVFAFTTKHPMTQYNYSLKLENMLRNIEVKDYKILIFDAANGIAFTNIRQQKRFGMLIQRNKVQHITSSMSKNREANPITSKYYSKNIVQANIPIVFYEFYRSIELLEYEELSRYKIIKDKTYLVDQAIVEGGETLLSVVRHLNSKDSSASPSSNVLSETWTKLNKFRDILSANLLTNMAYIFSMRIMIISKFEYRDKQSTQSQIESDTMFDKNSDVLDISYSKENVWKLHYEYGDYKRDQNSKDMHGLVDVLLQYGAATHKRDIELKGGTKNGVPVARLDFKIHHKNILPAVLRIVKFDTDMSHARLVVSFPLNVHKKEDERTTTTFENITKRIVIKDFEIFLFSSMRYTMGHMSAKGIGSKWVIMFISMDELLRNTFDIAVQRFLSGALTSKLYISNYNSMQEKGGTDFNDLVKVATFYRSYSSIPRPADSIRRLTSGHIIDLRQIDFSSMEYLLKELGYVMTKREIERTKAANKSVEENVRGTKRKK